MKIHPSKPAGSFVIRMLFLAAILFTLISAQPPDSARALSFAAEINKSFTPIAIVAGQTSRLNITIYNPNTFQLDNASFTDSLVGVQPGLRIATPANLANTCGGIVIASAGTATISLSGGTVPAQVGSVPGACTVSVDVTSTTAGNLINTIPAYGVPPAYGGVGLHSTARGGLDIITNTTPASATLQVGAVQPPSMNKNFNPNTVWVGESSQLEINIYNNDLTNALTQATFTDNLPTPFVVAAPLTTSLNGCGAGTLIATVGAASITLNNATIAPNSNCRVRVRVVSSTQGQYTNTIPVGPGGPGSLQTQQGVTNTSPVAANINVQAVNIAKAFNPVSFSQGDTSVLTITLYNPTGTNYTGVGLVDNLPAGLTVSGTPASPQCGGTITSTATAITLSGGAIPAGNVTTPGSCKIVALVTSTTPVTYINTIPANAMTGPITNLLPATATVVVQPRTIGVVKAFGGNFVQGGTTTLTITLQNTTNTAFTGVAFTDNLPAGLTIVGSPTASASCGGGAIVSSTATSVSLSNGIIPPGTILVPGTCVITATVTATVAGTYPNTIPVNGVTSGQGIGNNTASTGTVTVYPVGSPATVGKAFQTSPILAGAPTRLRITITAPNDTSLSAIYISDTLPDDLVIVGPPSPAPTTTCGGTLTAGTGTNLIRLTGGAIATAGNNCTITVYVTSNTAGVHTNTIPGNTLTSFEGRTDPNNRSANLTVTNFSISKSFTPGTISPTGLSRLTISLRNTNFLPLVNVLLTDLLTTMGGDASNGVFVAPTPNASTTCAGGTVTALAGSQTISMSGGTVPASDGTVPGLCTVSVDVQGIGVAATRTNRLLASAVIGTLQGTGSTMRPVGDATASLIITPLSIQVVKGFLPLTVFGGSSSVMSIQLVNPNTAPLSGIRFTDTMPAGMILANPVNPNVGTCGGTLSGAPGAGSFSFSGGSLPASGTCTLTLNATMTVLGNLTNTIGAGAVTTFEGASNPQAASASLTNLPGASIRKSFAPNPIPLGSYSLLTITIQNTSNVALTGMGLNDALPGTLPAGLEVAGAPAPINNCGGALTANPGSQNIQLVGGALALNASCTLVIPVTSTAPNSYLNTIPVSALTNDQNSTNNDPASDTLVVTSFSLGNRVWDDNGAGGGTANNGVRDGTEPGLGGVTVNLYRDSDNNGVPDGLAIATTTTDGNGYYRFDSLTADNYIVEVVPPAGYIGSAVNGGDPDTNPADNDNNGVIVVGGNVRSNPVTLGPGASEPTNDNDPVTNPEPGEAPNDQSNRTVDFGFYQIYSLGNRVWNDNGAGGGTANDGIRNGTEPGIGGVTVRLYRGGTLTTTTVTDANGYYRFDNLTAGSYTVEVITPAGYTSSPVSTSDPNSDVDNDNNGAVVVGSNVRSNPVTLGPGASEPTNDNDPATNPETGEAPNNQSNRSVDFAFTAAYSLGNRVWDDNGAGGGTANNGIRNGTEPGIDGLTVNLYRGGTLIATTTTAGGGYYRFDGLPANNYIVEVAIPTGYASSAVSTSDPNDDVDNDNNGVTVAGGYIRSNAVTLGPGASEPIDDNDPATNPLAGEAANNYSNRTVDFGFYHPPYSLGNRVWNDNGAGAGIANNGLLDGGEIGLSGVTVRLYRDSNNDGAPDGATIAIATTDINGNYRFDYLIADTYIVEVAIPTGYAPSAVNFGDPDTNPADNDNNGVIVVGGNIRSNPVTLGPGASEPIGEVDQGPLSQPGNAPDAYSNLTVDFGFAPLASLGDFVWNDLNQDGIQDAGENGIPGVRVNLYTGAGALVATTTTGGGGLYRFTSLVPGNYYVVFTPLAGWTISPMDVGGNDAIDSDANPATGQAATTTLDPGENDMTWDAGMYQVPASLGDYVWNDLNQNGIQDAGETGINGVRVDLYRPGYGPDGIPGTTDDNSILSTTTTAGGGLYGFTGLIPGNYNVVFTPPAGYAFSPMDVGGNDAIDSDANITTGQTATTTLDPGENDPTWDAGLYQLASLGDFVWNDLNRDGLQDAGEGGIGGVTVNLYTGTGTLVATTTTTAAGAYNFTSLVPGDYYLVFSLPAGYAFSPMDVGGNDAIDSDANTITGQTATTTLVSGENDLTWDAGLYQLASLGDYVWNDLNRNGLQDAGETGINGVTVNLYTGTGTFVATTTTAGGGLYNFTSLVPGDYYVVFTLPTGYQFSPQDQGGNDAIDSDANVTTGQAVTTTLAPGENDLTWDAGIYLIPASLGNYVWLDTNGNGIQEAGEPGINGVTVDLYTGLGAFVATTTTANVAGVDGIYSFTGLTPDYYYVVFTPPAGYIFSLVDQGGNDALDSDAIAPTGQTALTLLDPGENDLTWDAGLTQPASLGDFVWLDTNGNGLQDAGETGVDGVTVRLYTGAGGLVATTTTAGGGLYQFTGLIPGNYYVVFTQPAGYQFSPQDQGANDAIDSDANITTGQTTTTLLVSGENDLTWDAGLYQTTALGDFVWHDINGNGLQDAGEPGIDGVIANLYTGAGTFVSTTTTAGGGLYLFPNLTPGDYYVVFTPPAGYAFSPRDQGANDAIDSDANATGQTATTSLASNVSDLTWDAGLYQSASLGDYVWLDTDGNGLQDAGETGIDGVTVRLYTGAGALVATTTTTGGGLYLFPNLISGDYDVVFTPPTGYQLSLRDQGANDAIDSDPDRTTGRTAMTTLVSGENDLTWDAGLYQPASLGNFVWNDLNANGIQDAGEPGINGVTVRLYTGTGTPVATTTTAGGGLYNFTGLIPDNYFVEFVPPAGYSFSPADQGANDAIDSDANPATARTVTTTLVSGENDLTWDAGLNISQASLGNFVWLDTTPNGIQDAGEPGINGVTVNLYTSTGALVSTTTTSAGGYYSFAGLTPGDYYVEFVPPANYSFAPADQGANDAIDSDANPATGRTVTITLVAGENDLTWDAGLNSTLASLGNFVWNDLNSNGLQDAGEQGVGGVTITLYTGTGTVVATTTTAADGYYAFTNLTPGDYYVVFTLPSGYVFSPQDQGGNDAVDSDAAVTTGQTATTTLTAGENDLTWDAGLILLAKIGLAKRVVDTPVLVSPGTWDVTFEFLLRNYGPVSINNVQVVDNLVATFPAPMQFAVRSLSSPTFTVNWPGFNGSTSTNLLAGADTLNVNASGTITLVVRVTPTAAGPFNNTAVASGQDLYGNIPTDISDDGPDPDGNGNGDPFDDSDPTPINFGPSIFDPPYGLKTFDSRDLPLLRWTMVWINNSNIVAINVQANDPIPEGLTFSASGLASGYPVPVGAPAGSTNVGVSCKPDPKSSVTKTTLCYFEGPTVTYPYGRVIWRGILGPDFGATNEDSARNEIYITFNSTVNAGVTQVKNVGTIDVDRNGNGNTTDPGETEVSTATATWRKPAKKLPDTGFAPGVVSILSAQPADLTYAVYDDLRLEIPALNLKTSILGIPFSDDNWDINWLGRNAGWLDGTAFPGWSGNSVLTGHVYTADGLPGPFVDLNKLIWGDKVIVHALGQKYTFEVRSTKIAGPNDVSVLAHKDTPWLTLITCKEYDETSHAYRWRVVIQAVLIKTEAE